MTAPGPLYADLAPAERTRLCAWLDATYTDAGVELWWRHYALGGDEQRRRMIAAARSTSEGGGGW